MTEPTQSASEHGTDEQDTEKESLRAKVQRLESLVEHQQETIEQLQARQEPDSADASERAEQETPAEDETTTDEGLSTPVSRRGVLTATGALGLLGLGAGSASASSGQIGTSSSPLNKLYTDELNGGVTGGTSLTDLAGSGLTIDDSGNLNASGGGSTSELVTSGNSLTAAQVFDGGTTVSESDDSSDAPLIINGHPSNNTGGVDPFGATIAGGGGDSANSNDNEASADFATVGGGKANSAIYTYSTVGGGRSNTTNESYATIPGGRSNTADGEYSFAAGRKANTNSNDGAFVWGDSSSTSVTAGAADEVRFQAKGGFVIENGNVDAQGGTVENTTGGLTLSTSSNDLTLSPSGDVDVSSNTLTSVDGINGGITSSKITELDGSGLTVNNNSLETTGGSSKWQEGDDTNLLEPTSKNGIEVDKIADNGVGQVIFDSDLSGGKSQSLISFDELTLKDGDDEPIINLDSDAGNVQANPAKIKIKDGDFRIETAEEPNFNDNIVGIPMVFRVAQPQAVGTFGLSGTDLAFAVPDDGTSLEAYTSSGSTELATFSTQRMKTSVESYADNPESVLDIHAQTYTLQNNTEDDRLGIIAEHAHDAGLDWLVEYRSIEDAWRTGDEISDEYIEEYGIERDGETVVPNDIHDRAWLAMHQELLRDLVEDRDACTEEIAELEADIDAQEAHIDAQEARIEDKQDRIERLESKVDNKDVALDALREALDDKDERIDDLEAENEQLQERNADLEDRLAAVEAELGIDATASQQGVADD